MKTSFGFFIVIGIAMCAVAVFFATKAFGIANSNEVYRKKLEDYLRRLVRLDKQYSAGMPQIQKNLNKITFLLRTGNEEPEFSEKEKPKTQMEIEALSLRLEKEKKLLEMACKTNEAAKACRNGEFHVDFMDENPGGTVSMDFYYSEEYGEQIFYCVTPEALDEKKYRYALYFTTAMPNLLPAVYPHKYEGATMRSLYSHPSQAIWFLSNWKLIREKLESIPEATTDMDHILSDFNV
ncbi:MAG: hypothetical protein HUJ71_03195 [Pseudobutyrivibrio sp.]|nr:hypothetical protein [Pseudobutyrivibrio sp.]